MVVRGDSTLMDASSASGCDFSYGVFPSSSGLQARWRSTWASFPLLFGLIVVGICRMVQHSPPATEHRGFYDTRVAIFSRWAAWPNQPAASRSKTCTLASKSLTKHRRPSAPQFSGVRVFYPRGGEIFGTQGQVCVRVLHCLRLRNARGTGVVVI